MSPYGLAFAKTKSGSCSGLNFDIGRSTIAIFYTALEMIAEITKKKQNPCGTNCTSGA